MIKTLLTALLGISMLAMAGCVEPSGKELTQTALVPLTSSQIQTLLADSSLVGKNLQGGTEQIYISSSLEAQFINSPSGRTQKYELLKNGILCTSGPDRRFCFRVFVNDEDIRIVYADGTPEFQGKITKGNIFTS